MEYCGLIVAPANGEEVTIASCCPELNCVKITVRVAAQSRLIPVPLRSIVTSTASRSGLRLGLLRELETLRSILMILLKKRDGFLAIAP
jgi:hypothetical protein